LDRGTIGRLRSVRRRLTGDVNSGEVGGSAVDSSGLRRWTPAVSGGGKVVDEVRHAIVVLVMSLVAANSSRNSGYGRMELSNFD
jgi:hypothetical protein